MKVAIKQPYFMPYLGYFQLVKSVDVFVLYDDVNYYKRGFINRNNILVNNNSTHYLTIPVKGASQHKLINEVEILKSSKEYINVLKTIDHSYKKAPYFTEVYPIIEKIIQSDAIYISELNHMSIIEVSKYLKLNTKFIVSSEQFSDSRGIGMEERIIEICKRLDSDTYISELGGKDLYHAKHFRNHGIDFRYIIPHLSEYVQFNFDFVPSLSIIDVLMFNSIDEVNKMLDKYEIE